MNGEVMCVPHSYFGWRSSALSAFCWRFFIGLAMHQCTLALALKPRLAVYVQRSTGLNWTLALIQRVWSIWCSGQAAQQNGAGRILKEFPKTPGATFTFTRAPASTTQIPMI